MDFELEIIGKEAVVAYVKVSSTFTLKNCGKPRKMSIRAAETRSRYLPDRSEACYSQVSSLALSHKTIHLKL